MNFPVICRLFVSLLVVGLGSMRANAQEALGIKKIVGDEHHVPEDFRSVGLTRLSSGEYIRLGEKYRDEKSIQIQRLDTNGIVIKEQIVVLNDIEIGFESQGTVEVGNKIYWLYLTTVDKEREKVILNAREIDLSSCSLSPERKKLFGPLSFGEMPRRLFPVVQSDVFEFALSPDRSKLMIRGHYVSDDKKERHFGNFTVWVFDEQLNELWSKKALLTDGSLDMAYCPMIVDNNAQVYTTTDNYSIKIDDNNPRAVYFYKLTKDSLSRTEVTLPGKKVSDAMVAHGVDGRIYLAGCYSEEKKMERDGFYLFYVGADNALKTLSGVNTFSYQQLGINDNNRAGYSALRMFIRRIHQEKSGKIYLFGEEDNKYHFYEMSYPILFDNDKPKPVRTKKYIYKGGPTVACNDVAVACINPDGTLQWMNGAGKRQTGPYFPSGMSFAGIVHNDVCYIFYKDNIKNLKKNLGEAQHGHNGLTSGYLTVTVIDQNGKSSKQTVSADRDSYSSLILYNPLSVEKGKLCLRAGFGIITLQLPDQPS